MAGLTSSEAISTHPSDTSDLSALSSDEAVQQPKPRSKPRPSTSGVVESKKRARESGASAASGSGKENKNKKAKVVKEGEKGVYCHQCRRACDMDSFVRCTKLKQKSKHVLAPCNHAFCDNDLVRRYGISPQAVRWEGTTNVNGHGHGDAGGHDPKAEYVFECPCCSGQCQNSECRKKKGLAPLGDVVKAAKAAGLPDAAALLNSRPTLVNGNAKPNDDAPARELPSGPARYTSVIELSDDSELSEPESDEPKVLTPKAVKKQAATPKPTKSKAETPKVKAQAKVETPKDKMKTKAKVNGNGNGNGSSMKGTPKNGKVEPKGAKGSAKKAKGEMKSTPKKPAKGKAKETDKPKPIKKPEIPVDPPVFEKVDTKLGLEEATQRIMLREYLLRFRPVLTVPERALPPVDDFDRPLTEANVRLFAGAMLDAIREELENQGGDDDLIDGMSQNREELRYYADLARFAAIYNSLASPLNLRLPPPIIDHRAQNNDAALRALLDLDEKEATPAWAADLTAGPSRRVGASRIPQPVEVIRMLLALAERTLSTPAIRGDLEYFTPENDARRKHASAVKKEMTAWEAKQKKLAQALVQSRSAAETKANKELTKKEQHEHNMRVALQNVNLCAALSRRAIRHEPIGTDLDGRVYYALTPRTVEEDGRPPFGWASGLLVWGTGVPRKEGTTSSEELPVGIERWSHFGKSSSVKELIKWIEWRYKKATPARSSATTSTPTAKSPGKAKAKAEVKATPSKGKTKATPTTTPKQRTLLQVLIPTSNKRKSTSSLSDADADVNGDASRSRSSSDLTPPPTTAATANKQEQQQQQQQQQQQELLALVAPKDYKPSKGVIEEQKSELLRRLKEVAEWLEVLEWKGMGEVE